ncbi:MAG: glycosyltransferase family 1 protein, partial [Gemmatimonadales bacterium]
MLDITEFFGDTTGGVRTYLLEKAKYVQRNPALRQVLVVPGARDEILEAGGVRCYRLHGPHIPTQKPYRFMLATRSTKRIVAHERPDLIEVGSAWCAP